MRSSPTVLTALLLSFFPFTLPAATAFGAPAASPEKSADHFEQQQQSRYQEELRRQLLQEGRSLVPASPANLPAVPGYEPAFLIRSIHLTGLPPSLQWLHAEAQRSEGQKLGLAGIRLLAAQLQNRLLDRGFITTRITIPNQNVQSGHLELQVQPGYIHDIRWIDPTPHLLWQNAFPIRPGQILNLRDLEQGLEQLNRLAYQKVTMQLLPASEAYGTDVLLSRRQLHSPLYFSLTYDNSGLAQTGKQQISSTFIWENPFHRNDELALTLSSDDKKHPGWRGSENQFLSWSIPAGKRLFSLYYNHYFDYQPANASFRIHSHRTSWGIQGKQLLSRDQRSKWYANFGLVREWRHTYLSNLTLSEKNNFELSQLERNTTALTLGLSTVQYRNGGILAASLSHTAGLPWLGAKQTSLPDVQETTQYRMWQSDLTFLKNFPHSALPHYYTGSLHIQYSPDTLYSNNQISLGGRYTVRGFDGEHTLSSESGWYWRNEWAFPLRQRREIYLAADAGRIYGPSAGNYTSNLLAGCALGLRKTTGTWQYDLSVGWPLRQPQELGASSVTYGFSASCHF